MKFLFPAAFAPASRPHTSTLPIWRMMKLPRTARLLCLLAMSACGLPGAEAAPDATPDLAISGDTIAPTGIAFGRNGQVFISEYQNGNELHIWPSIPNWVAGNPSHQAFNATTGESVAVSPDGSRVAVALTEGGSFINIYGSLGDGNYGFLRQFGGNNAMNPGDPGGTSTVNDTSLAFPRGLRWTTENGQTYLWVADDAFHRILRYSLISITLAANVNASLVLGAPNLTTRGSLPGVKDIEFDEAGNLYAVSYDGKRIMRFNQPFVSGRVVPDVTLTLTASPVNLAFSGTTLYTSMPVERKVWAFDNLASRGNGAIAPDRVLGADSGALRLGNGNFGPQGIAFDPVGNLYVCDLDNNRVVRFDNVFPQPTIKVKGKVLLTTSHSKLTVRGTATDATSVEYKVGKKKYKTVPLTSDRWKLIAKLKTGRNVLKIRAVGPGGNSKLAKIVAVRL